MCHFCADGQIERLRVCAILQYHLRGIDAAIGTSNTCAGHGHARGTASNESYRFPHASEILVTMGADVEPLSVSLMDLIAKRIQIIGSQQNGPEYLYEALDYVAQGKVKSIIETYPLVEAPKAYQRVAEGKARFRAVLTM